MANRKKPISVQFPVDSLLTKTDRKLLSGLTWNKGCWAYPIDLSCASIGNTHAGIRGGGTLISSRHVALANHFPLPVGTTMRFLDRSDNVVDRVLTAVARVAKSDILLGYLDQVVDITPASVLESASKLKVGLPLLYLNQKKEANLGEIVSFGGGVMMQKCLSSPLRGKFFKAIVVYDSGHPIFLVDGDKIEMVSHFTTSSGGISYARVLPDIVTTMASLGPEKLA